MVPPALNRASAKRLAPEKLAEPSTTRRPLASMTTSSANSCPDTRFAVRLPSPLNVVSGTPAAVNRARPMSVKFCAAPTRTMAPLSSMAMSEAASSPGPKSTKARPSPLNDVSRVPSGL